MTVAYAACGILFVMGIYGLLTKRHLLKLAMSAAIIAQGLGLLVLLMGFSDGQVGGVWQALGMAVLLGGTAAFAVMAVCAVKLYERAGSMDINEISRLKG